MGDVREYQFVTGIETSTIPDPGTPVAANSTISLGYADDTYARFDSWQDSKATVAAVKAIAAADRYDNQVVFIEELGAFFYFDAASSATGDDTTVIQPTVGTGRWLITSGGAAAGIDTNWAMKGFQNFIYEEELTPVTGTPGAGEFKTFGIVNRSKIKNPITDLKPASGVQTIKFHEMGEVLDETGPSGEKVNRIATDSTDRIRFVGGWEIFTNNTGRFIQTSTPNTTDFVEIVFYGTGLNILAPLNASFAYGVTIDGGTESTTTTATFSSVLGTRNYSMNSILPITSGLTLDLHSVKIRNNSGSTQIGFYGIQILNESTSIETAEGTGFIDGKQYLLNAADTASRTTGFDDIQRDGSTVGSLSTKGNCTLVYFKDDGTVGKSAVEVNASSATLGSASHTYEEMIRYYNFREFGNARSDDFTLIDSTAVFTNRYFTTSDDTTNLNGTNVTTDSNGNYLGMQNGSSFWEFTFVGSGIDLDVQGSGSGTSDAFVLDNTSIGTLTVTSGLNSTIKIASGLPFGTHKLRYARASAQYFLVKGFKVYGPKTPELPSGAVEIGKFYKLADFSANSTANTNTVSTGVVRKHSAVKSAAYVNGTGGTTDWAISANSTNFVSGATNTSDRNGAYFEQTFWGTGFDMRFSAQSNRSANITVLVNGTLLTTGNFPTASFSVYGTGVAFNSGTGILDQADAATSNGSGFVVSGLTEGQYTVRFTNNTASSFLAIDTMDIIQQIYAPHDNPYAENINEAAVGGTTLLDTRALSPLKKEDVQRNVLLHCRGITSGPTTAITTPLLIPQMYGLIDHDGGWIRLSFQGVFTHNTVGGTVVLRFVINGSLSANTWTNTFYTSGVSMAPFISIPYYLPAGKYFMGVNWNTSAGTLTASTTLREFTVNKIDRGGENVYY